MNIKTLLAAAGVNLDDVRKHAENIIGEARKELDLLHKKIDAHSAALILIDEKLDALMARKENNGNASDGTNANNSNRTDGNGSGNSTVAVAN